jgi:glutamine synthetase
MAVSFKQPTSPAEALKLADEAGAQFVDFRFVDLPGQQQHFTVPRSHVSEATFTEGLGFDGSSIRGWKVINESDMLIMPDATTAFIDPFLKHKTLVLLATIVEPVTFDRYPRDPRGVAVNCEAYVKSLGIADTVFIGPELEFFVFDGIRFESKPHESFFQIESDEAIWSSGRKSDVVPNLGHRPRHKEGYFPVPPLDSLQDLRSEMTLLLQSIGIDVEAQHHEVATAGQCEIDMRFSPLVKMADWALNYKYIIKNAAKQAGKTATFMPKPMYGDNGSGMHVHVSLWKGGENTFAGKGYAGLSDTALYFIGGLLKHARAVLAFTSPTTNSYKRLVPGYEAPVNLAYSARNRSAAVRIPMYSQSAKAKRIEFRPPDPSANFYLAYSAIVMAGVDGILNKIHPGNPLDKNIYDLPPEEAKGIPTVPGSLAEAMDCLEADHEFLLKGDVFTKDLIEAYIAYKREAEVAPIALRPTPHEYFLYYDV